MTVKVERPFVHILELESKILCFSSFRKYATSVTSSLVIQNTILIAAEIIKRKSMTAEIMQYKCRSVSHGHGIEFFVCEMLYVRSKFMSFIMTLSVRVCHCHPHYPVG